MSRNKRGYISVDVNDLLNEVDDDDLIAEVEDRNLLVGRSGEAVPLDVVREAYLELLRGRAHEAQAILDRLLNPKWKSDEACLKQYEAAKS